MKSQRYYGVLKLSFPNQTSEEHPPHLL